MRLAHDRLLATALAEPDETQRRVRRAAAVAEHARGQAIVERCGPVAAAALAFLDATRIDPTFDDAKKSLLKTAPAAGLTLKKNTEDPAIQQLLAALRLQPRQATLWRKLADLRHARGELADEAVALKRAARLRNDEEVRKRLALLLLGPRAELTEITEAASPLLETGTTPLLTRRRRPAPSPVMVGAITLALGAGLGFGGARMMTVEEPAAPPFIERLARLKEQCPGAACAEQLSAVDLKTLLLADHSPQIRELSRRLDECERSCAPR